LNPERQAGNHASAARELAKALEGVSARLDAIDMEEAALARRGRLTWRLTWALFSVVVLVVALLAYGGNVAQCRSSDRVRAEQTALWERTLPHIVNNAGTPAGKAALAKLRRQVAADFAPRDCYALHA